MRTTAATSEHIENIFAALRPRPKVKVSKWARENIVLSGESSHAVGAFEPFPYQDDAMDDANDPDVIESVLSWAGQLGKSTVVNATAGFFAECDPSPSLMVQPTVELAGAYSKDRIAPMFRDSPALARVLKDPRTRDSGNTILSKSYPGGSLVLVGANAPAGLAGRPRRVVLQDEIDRFPASAGTEGDPCALADKRAESFPNAVKLKTSTPTTKGVSKIEARLEQSDFQKWHCGCPRCQHEQVWMWSHVQWPEGKPEEAWLECEGCKAHLTDAERIASILGAKWKATRPFTGIRGRWLNGINTLFRQHKGYRNRLHQMAAEFLKAKEGGRETMRVWVNTFLAETFEESAETVDGKQVHEAVEDYSPDHLPTGVLLAVAGVDVQKTWIEVELVGYGRDEERWDIQKIRIDGHPVSDEEVWSKLDEVLLRKFTRTDGVELGVSRAFVDMQFATPEVLKFCAPRLGRGVYACRGVNREGAVVPPLLPAKPSRNNRARIPHWNVGVTVAKTSIYDRLLLPAPGPRTFHYPKGHGYDLDHFRQLTSEKRKVRYSHGVPYFIFEKPTTATRNEALDITVYAYAAMHSLQPIGWTRLAENLSKRATKKDDEPPAQSSEGSPPPPAAQPRRIAIPRRNWATSW